MLHITASIVGFVELWGLAFGIVYLILVSLCDALQPATRRVGGIRFFRIGRARLSFCVARSSS